MPNKQNTPSKKMVENERRRKAEQSRAVLIQNCQKRAAELRAELEAQKRAAELRAELEVMAMWLTVATATIRR